MEMCYLPPEPELENLEERMRIETPSVPQSQIESPKAIEKEELTESNAKDNTAVDESQSFIPSPLGSSRTYSLSSLRAAVDYHAKFLTVAESNLKAVNHPSTIPQGILDRLNCR
jgi:hypothetical protein